MKKVSELGFGHLGDLISIKVDDKLYILYVSKKGNLKIKPKRGFKSDELNERT